MIHLHQTTFENIVAIGEIDYNSMFNFFSGIFEAVDNENFTFKRVFWQKHRHLKIKEQNRDSLTL